VPSQNNTSLNFQREKSGPIQDMILEPGMLAHHGVNEFRGNRS